MTSEVVIENSCLLERASALGLAVTAEECPYHWRPPKLTKMPDLKDVQGLLIVLVISPGMVY